VVSGSRTSSSGSLERSGTRSTFSKEPYALRITPRTLATGVVTGMLAVGFTGSPAHAYSPSEKRAEQKQNRTIKKTAKSSRKTASSLRKTASSARKTAKSVKQTASSVKKLE